MQAFATLILAAAAVSAQVSYNEATQQYVCSKSNGAYCAGNSLESNIIIRCSNGTGFPDNCNDNLARVAPGGVSYSPCYQTSETAGDAVCSRGCILYNDDGSTKQLDPNVCGGSTSGTTSSENTISNTTSTPVAVPMSTGKSGGSVVADSAAPYPTNGTFSIVSGSNGTSGMTTAAGAAAQPTTVVGNDGKTTVIPAATGAAGSDATGGGAAGGDATGGGDSAAKATGTAAGAGTAAGTAAGGSDGSATATPVKPTASTVVTAGAAINSVGGVLAAMGLLAAYLL